MPMRRTRIRGQRTNRPSKKTRMVRFEQLESRMLLTGLPYGAVAQDTGEYMLGDIVVTVVFFESDGTLDANQEDWNPLVRDEQGNVVLDDAGQTISASGPNLIEQTKGRVIEGLEWWQDTLANFYASNYDDVAQVHSLNFIYDFQYANNPVATSYEPINRTSNEHAFWVADFLDEAGYLETGFMETDIRAFNNAQRVTYDADWAYTIFVANDYNDDDGMFAAGGRFSRAFAFSGGRYLVSPAGRPGSTFAHESGHIFYARDEYSGSGAHYTDHRGYYDSQNWNAYDNPAPGFVQQSSIMDSGADFTAAWAANVSSESSLAMIGWQDSDGDGVFDVLDVPLTLTGTGYFDSHQDLYHFLGHSEVQTLVNVNPSGRGNDITINEVSRLVYSLDNGLTWNLARSYDSPEVDIDVSIPLQPGQEILLRTEAVDPITGKIVATSGELLRGSTALPTGVSQSGIGGFVWDDRDTDGQWDQNERGVSGWTLQLVDQQGAAIETAQYLKPDDYANETLLNQVLAGVTLSAVGMGTKDTRVGAINTDVASAGDRVLGFVRSGIDDEWEIEWTSITRVLRVDFDQPTTYISIDAIALADGALGRLEIYDAAGNLLGRTTTGALRENDNSTIAIGVATPKIAYALVRSNSEAAILLDNLQVGPSATVTSGYFGAYAMPYLAPGGYHVMAVPNGDWEVATPASGIVDVTIDAEGRMEWPDGADRPSDFAAAPAAQASMWSNLAFSVDVNDDWLLSPIDALQVIHDLNTNGGRQLSAESDGAAPPFIDVNGDAQLSPIDALLVITALNDATQNGGQNNGGSSATTVTAWASGVGLGGGEGEALAGTTAGLDSGSLVATSDAATVFVSPASGLAENDENEAMGLVVHDGVVQARTRLRPLAKTARGTALPDLFALLGRDGASLSNGLFGEGIPHESGVSWNVRNDTKNETDNLGTRSLADRASTAEDAVESYRIAASQFDDVVALIAADVWQDELRNGHDTLSDIDLVDDVQDTTAMP